MKLPNNSQSDTAVSLPETKQMKRRVGPSAAFREICARDSKKAAGLGLKMRASAALPMALSLLLPGVIGLGSRQTASAQVSACVNPPGPDQITIWQDANFTGPCKTLGIGSFPNSSFLSPVSNDSVSSLKVGQNVRAHLFQDTDFSGHVALYESGSAHNTSVDGFLGLGPNVNDKTTSIIVQPTFGVRVPYVFITDHPSNWTNQLSKEAQGLCHTDTHWFFTRNNPPTLYKIQLGADLSLSQPAMAGTTIPQSLLQGGYNHMGDPDCYKGFVFVPLEATNYSKIPKVAVFNTSDLSYVNSDDLYVNDDKHSGWVAIDPSNGNDLWTSRTQLSGSGVQGVFRYQIDWSQVKPNGGYIFFGGAGPVKPLLNRRGQQLAIEGMQGGVFNKGQGGTTGDGSILFLTNSDHDSRDGHGLWAFLKTTGALIGESSNDYGPFRYTTDSFLWSPEEEGLDFFCTHPSVTPGISGCLHAVLLNNGITDDRDSFYIKHYGLYEYNP